MLSPRPHVLLLTSAARLAQAITLDLQLVVTVHVAADVAAGLRTLVGVRGFSGFLIHEPLMKDAAPFVEEARRLHPNAALVVLSSSTRSAVAARARKLGALLLREASDRGALLEALRLSL